MDKIHQLEMVNKTKFKNKEKIIITFKNFNNMMETKEENLARYIVLTAVEELENELYFYLHMI